MDEGGSYTLVKIALWEQSRSGYHLLDILIR
jgi:hypothetical protein